jgi:hypothetical protein
MHPPRSQKPPSASCRPKLPTPLPLSRRAAPPCCRRGEAAAVRPGSRGQRTTDGRRPCCGWPQVRLTTA